MNYVYTGVKHGKLLATPYADTRAAKKIMDSLINLSNPNKTNENDVLRRRILNAAFNDLAKFNRTYQDAIIVERSKNYFLTIKNLPFMTRLKYVIPILFGK